VDSQYVDADCIVLGQCVAGVLVRCLYGSVLRCYILYLFGRSSSVHVTVAKILDPWCWYWTKRSFTNQFISSLSLLPQLGNCLAYHFSGPFLL